MNRMDAPYIRTGAESILGIRADDKFVVSAIDKGVVISVSKDLVVVDYKDNGRAKYPLKKWTTKEEAGITYEYAPIPNLKRGDTFNKDDTLVYIAEFFEPDLFNPKRVIGKLGTSITMALMEAPETYEDSTTISTKASKIMGTTVTHVKSIVVMNTDSILKVIPVGSKTEPKLPLLSIANETLSNISELDSKALEILKGIKLLSPKAGYRGTVTKIRIYYNSELKELTPTLRKLVNMSDELLQAETGYTGLVNNEYSIEGKPLLEGEVEIKYYITSGVAMGTGDKGVLANQLKCTIGAVYDNVITTEDGTVVDGITSAKSIEARIVNSTGLIGTTSKLLELVSTSVTDDYFN